MVPFAALLFALIVTTAAVRRPHERRGLRGALRWLAPYAATCLAAAGLFALWYFHRPQPEKAKLALFHGVSYERDVRTSPRPIVAHIVTIDLRDPYVSFAVTPRAEAGFLGATTSQYLIHRGVQLAINGDFFRPWWSDNPFDFYPHTGDPTEALGASVSAGVESGQHLVPYSALVFYPRHRTAILHVTDPDLRFSGYPQVISGKHYLVEDGFKAEGSAEQPGILHPRTAAGLDRSRTTLLVVVVDGRQPGYSEGMTLDELAELLIAHGADRAMNLDGGGSSALVIEDGEGGARQLNVPIHTRIPWRERPVANHLGVFAAPL